MKFKLKILTKDNEFEFTVKNLSAYQWDKLLGFDNEIEDLKDLAKLKSITDMMIKSNFLDEFYMHILDKEKSLSSIYKDYLIYILYNIQFDNFDNIEEFKKPSLIFVESYQNNEGDFIKYDYVNENFTYEKVRKEYE